MLGVVGFIRSIFEWGFWLIALGLMKPTLLLLLALTYDTYTTPRFSFSKFNRMLVGEMNDSDAKSVKAKISNPKE